LTRYFVALTLAAFALFWIFGDQLWGLIVGVITLDLGLNSASICCHTRNYRLLPNATNRVATIYITAFFVGGSIGTKLATYGWQHFGYSGVCAAGAALLAIAAIVLLMPAPKPRLAK
jgi:predicted MFS family arabinose efflux permease